MKQTTTPTHTLRWCFFVLSIGVAGLACGPNQPAPQPGGPAPATNAASPPPVHNPLPPAPEPSGNDFLLMTLPFGVDASLDTPEKIAAVKARFKKLIQSGARLSDAAPRMIDVLRKAKLRPGAVVADIGCGTGFLEYAVLEHKIPVAKVYAVDIEPQALDIVRFVLNEAKHPDRAKIELVLSKRDDVALADASVDDALVINTAAYGDKGDENENALQVAWIKSMRRAMRDDGRLHIFENGTIYRESTLEQKTKHLKQLGFRQLDAATQTGDDFLYMVFVKK